MGQLQNKIPLFNLQFRRDVSRGVDVMFVSRDRHVIQNLLIYGVPHWISSTRHCGIC